jgi:hypothetical protein
MTLGLATLRQCWSVPAVGASVSKLQVSGSEEHELGMWDRVGHVGHVGNCLYSVAMWERWENVGCGKLFRLGQEPGPWKLGLQRTC